MTASGEVEFNASHNYIAITSVSFIEFLVLG